MKEKTKKVRELYLFVAVVLLFVLGSTGEMALSAIAAANLALAALINPEHIG